MPGHHPVVDYTNQDCCKGKNLSTMLNLQHSENIGLAYYERNKDTFDWVID